MREIKFRAWDGKNIKNVLWINFNNDELRLVNGVSWYYKGNLKNCELMQYTGLKDVDGVEIYEGDILLNCYDHFGEEKSYIAGVVKWSEFEVDVQGAVCSTPLIGFNIDGVALATDEKYKVVGNIHESPDLLGETK